MPLTPTPELVATARRAAGRDWTVGPEGAAAMSTDPHLAQLVTAGLVRMVFTPAHRLADDYWTLTDAGRTWLADHDNQPKEHQ
jgi:hypothetical protein